MVDGKINLKGNIVDKNKFTEPPALNLAGGCFVEKAYSVQRKADRGMLGRR